MPSYERFLRRLKGLKQLPDSGTYLARWEARCPAHNDRTPSLSISLTADRLLVHCHAKCHTEAVVRAVGLQMSDLYLSPSAPAEKKRAPEKSSPPPVSANSTPPDESSSKSCRSHTKSRRSGRIEETYDYYDADGTLLYQVVRFEPKGFRQRRPNSKGGWTWSVRGVERVPYFLPEMLEAIGEGHPIVIVEGEKDAEAALQMLSSLEASPEPSRRFSATTAPGGAGKWESSFSRFFEGAHVWVVPDVDEAGFDHARQVAERLRGVAESIKVLRLPSTVEQFDLSDWAAQGKTAADLFRLADQSPYLLSRAHPTHEVDFEAVPGPSAPLQEIQEYLVSAGSVQSGRDYDAPSSEEAPKRDTSLEKASTMPPSNQQHKQPTSPGKPQKWEGIGVKVAEDPHATEAILSGLDQIESKSRNGVVGYSLPPSGSEIVESDFSSSNVSRSDVPTSDSDPDAESAHTGETEFPDKAESIKQGSGADVADILRDEETSFGEPASVKNRTSFSSAPPSSAESSFSSETRGMIRLLEEERVQVLNAGGAFYLVFPFLSTAKGSQVQASELLPPSFSGKAYPLHSPLVVPLLLRLAYDRGGWIPNPEACRAALLFLTPEAASAVQISARIATGNGSLYIDAGENTILEVKPGTWHARSSAPAIFLRNEHARPLPKPRKKASLTAFRRLLQIEADEAWVGIRGWLLGALCPTGQVPSLLLEGDAPRRLFGLARQLASLLDPRSSAPQSPLHPPLSTYPAAATDVRLGEVKQDLRFQQTSLYGGSSEATSSVLPFVSYFPASHLIGPGHIKQNSRASESALKISGSPLLETAFEKRDGHAQPLGTRLIFVGSGQPLPPKLRKGLLAVRPTFMDDPLTGAASRLALGNTDAEGHSERWARAEALGVLLNGAAEAMEEAVHMPLPEALRDAPHRNFLAWVAAAEAGLSPAALGSELSGSSSRPFVDVWREGCRQPGLLRRLVRALLQRVGWDSIDRTRS